VETAIPALRGNNTIIADKSEKRMQRESADRSRRETSRKHKQAEIFVMFLCFS